MAAVRNVKIVPLGGVDPETVAELAFGLKRRSGGKVEVLAPRRLRAGDPAGSLGQADAAGAVTLGIGADDADEPHVEGNRVIMMPVRRAGQTARAVDMALALLAAS